VDETTHQPFPQVRGRGFTIGTFKFRTKKAAITELRDVLNFRYRPGECLTSVDHDLIEALFQMHPERDIKAAKGVEGFTVEWNEKDGYARTRGFHVLHPDGSTTDFSFYVCLNNNFVRTTFEEAARAAIMPSQRLLRDTWEAAGGRNCTRCGKAISGSRAHVHHEQPYRFRDLLKIWREKHGEPAVIANPDFGADFADQSVKRRFVEWHDSIAVRTVLCAACNLAAEAGS
jgi:hypothetical protein